MIHKCQVCSADILCNKFVNSNGCYSDIKYSNGQIKECVYFSCPCHKYIIYCDLYTNEKIAETFLKPEKHIAFNINMLINYIFAYELTYAGQNFSFKKPDNLVIDEIFNKIERLLTFT